MGLGTLKNKLDKMPMWLRVLYYIAIFEVGLLVCFWLEVPAFYSTAKFANISGISGLLNLLKEAGYFQTWIIVSAALLLIDLPKKVKGSYNFLRRAVFLVSASLVSGIIAEILKLIIRRERPEPLYFNGGNFRGWVGAWWKSNDLGTPSSHAMVAFGAAWALCILFPQARIVWIFIGVGCAFSRMAHQAHLLGDVYIACVLSYIITKILAKKILPLNKGEEDKLEK